MTKTTDLIEKTIADLDDVHLMLFRSISTHDQTPDTTIRAAMSMIEDIAKNLESAEREVEKRDKNTPPALYRVSMQVSFKDNNISLSIVASTIAEAKQKALLMTCGEPSPNFYWKITVVHAVEIFKEQS